MKFAIQISEGCLHDFVSQRRVSFDDDDHNLFSEFQKLSKTADLYVDGDLNSFDLNHPIWKYFNLLTSGAGILKRKINSQGLYAFLKNDPSALHRLYFFEEDNRANTPTKPVFFTGRSQVSKAFGNVSCCKSDERFNSISIRRNSDFAREKWKLFRQFEHPTSTILVYDPYLFKGSIEKDINSRFKKTLIPLIKSISKSTQNIREINLIGSYHHFAGRHDTEEQVEQKRDRLKNYLQSVFYQKGFRTAPSIYLHKNRLEHDRRLLTDYVQIKPGSSFEFFNPYGHIPVQGFTVHVAPLYHNDIQKDVLDFKRALSKEIDLNHLGL